MFIVVFYFSGQKIANAVNLAFLRSRQAKFPNRKRIIRCLKVKNPNLGFNSFTFAQEDENFFFIWVVNATKTLFG